MQMSGEGMKVVSIQRLSVVPPSKYALMVATLEGLEVNGCMAVECASGLDKRLVRMRLYCAASDKGISVKTQSIGLRLEIQRVR